MNPMAELSKWLLEKDIRAKNASSFLFALLSVVVFYFASRRSEWFQDLDRYGAVGVAVALMVVLLIAFFTAWLVWSGVATYGQRRALIQKAKTGAEHRKRAVRNTLERLTDWQRDFLFRFIREDKTQIPEYEVDELGGYEAAWGSEIAVLIQKRIIIHHRGGGGVYELAPVYHDYLREHWNPQADALD